MAGRDRSGPILPMSRSVITHRLLPRPEFIPATDAQVMDFDISRRAVLESERCRLRGDAAVRMRWPLNSSYSPSVSGVM
jgi:hypothetical protein